KLCEWHLPATHYLEEWSDTQSDDGTVSIVQPLIRPMYEGRSQHEVLNIFLGEASLSGYETVRGRWLEKFGDGKSSLWNKALHDGLIEGTASEPVSVSFNEKAQASLGAQLPAATSEAEYT